MLMMYVGGKISSQWDGLRHYGYQDLKKYYNGATCDDIDSSSTLGIQGKPASITPAKGNLTKSLAWCRQGIAGRGVLLDYVRWSKSQSKQFDLISGILSY